MASVEQGGHLPLYQIQLLSLLSEEQKGAYWELPSSVWVMDFLHSQAMDQKNHLYLRALVVVGPGDQACLELALQLAVFEA